MTAIAPTMSPELFAQLLDQMIELQRKEQEAILDRKTDLLPDLCSRIDVLGGQIEMFPRQNLTIEDPAKPPTWAAQIRAKLKLVHDLAAQNHLLLDNSIWFLQNIFEEVLGFARQPKVYSRAGVAPQSIQSVGNLFNLTL